MSIQKQQAGAQSVYRAMEVLDAFDQGRVAMSVGEIASHTGLTVPTAHRLVTALASEGFLSRDEVSRTFGIGPAILRLAQVALSGESTYAFVEPLLRSLRDECEETVGLHVRVGTRRVCIRELESPHRVRVVSGVGHTYALTAAAASKAILAFTHKGEIGGLEDADPTLTGTDFQATLEAIRTKGYAVSHGETIPGAHAVAAPVLDADGCALAAVNITGPADRLPPDRLESLGTELVVRLRSISQARYAGLTSGAL